jgi:two-component system LytT family sensor kinase
MFWKMRANYKQSAALSTSSNSLFSKLLGNVYLRNIVFLLLLLASTVANKLYTLRYFDPMGFLNIVTGFSLYYLIFIFHNTVLYEKLWKKKKYFLYIAILSVVLISLDEVMLPIIRRIFHIPWQKENFYEKLLILYTRYINIYIAFAVYLGFTYFRQQENKLRLENLNREVELKQLKEQLNPHFLFNALNNIYSYTLENSANTGELLLKLSELIRYILENANKEQVTLGNEIDFTKHYIAFEQERLGERCTVHITTDISNPDVGIAPFILFTFIENAFKHGTATNKKSEISINIQANDECVNLHIINSIYRSKKESTKVGLANVQRRLQLLYPNKHTLALTESEGCYYTSLVLYRNY